MSMPTPDEIRKARARELDRRLRNLYSLLQMLQKQLRSAKTVAEREDIETDLRSITEEIARLISLGPDEALD